MALFSDYRSFLPSMVYFDGDSSVYFPQWVGHIERGFSRALTFSISDTATTQGTYISQQSSHSHSEIGNTSSEPAHGPASGMFAGGYQNGIGRLSIRELYGVFDRFNDQDIFDSFETQRPERGLHSAMVARESFDITDTPAIAANYPRAAGSNDALRVGLISQYMSVFGVDDRIPMVSKRGMDPTHVMEFYA